MSWLTSLGIALLAAVAGLLAAGFASSLAIGWVRVSAADGGHGWFGFFNAIYGFIGGFVIGLFVARFMAPGYTFAPSLLAATIAVVGVIGLITLVSRLMADVAPRSGGDEMVVAVQVRWPELQQAPPRAGSGRSAIDLTSGRSNGQRWPGELFFEEAELRESRSTVPGGVPLRAGRAMRSLDLVIDDAPAASFDIEEGAISQPSADWSAWNHSTDTGFALRYRVMRASDTYRRIVHGPFTITARVNDYFRWTETSSGPNPRGSVSIEFNDKPLLGVPTQHQGSTTLRDFDTVRRIVTITGADALVVESRELGCYVVADGPDGVSAAYITHCSHDVVVHEITNDAERFNAAGIRLDVLPIRTGVLDRDRLYLFNGAILDTHAFRVHQLALSQWIEDMPHRAPIGLAPDGLTFVRAAYRGYSGEKPALAITDLRGEDPYTLDVAGDGDPLDGAGPAWLLQHFEWVRHNDGWRLVTRARITQ